MPDYKHDLHAVHKKPDEKPKVLHIDIETRSGSDISKTGVRRYAEDKDFAILLYAYAFDDQPVTIIDLACGEKFPDWMIEYIHDAAVTKVAYNAMFERTCLSVYLGEPLSLDGWKCTMVQACYLSLPLSLEGCAEALKTVEQKDKEGHDLIRYFCVPCKPTKLNGGRTWNLPEHAPEKWDKFKYYCCQDVETERDIEKKISLYPISPHEMELYRLDQRINDRGVLVDMELVKQAIACDVMHSETATARAYAENGYLRDVTGNRRFWPVNTPGFKEEDRVRGCRPSWELSDEEVKQIWAEALYRYEQGEKLYLEGDIGIEAIHQQKMSMETDDREPMVREYLDKLLPANWDSLTLFQRRDYIQGTEFSNDGVSTLPGTVKRTVVCNQEIWCECFGRDRGSIGRQDSNSIIAMMERIEGWKRSPKKQRVKGYGIVNVYVRDAGNEE